MYVSELNKNNSFQQNKLVEASFHCRTKTMKEKDYGSLVNNTGNSKANVSKVSLPRTSSSVSGTSSIPSSPIHDMFSPTKLSPRASKTYKKRPKGKILVHDNALETNKVKKLGEYQEIIVKPRKSLDPFDLIDINHIEKSTPSPVKMTKKRKTETSFKVEGLLEISDDDDYDADKLKNNVNSQPKTLNEKIDSNNILHSLEQQNRSKYHDVLKKYKNKKIPKPIVSRKALLVRANKYMDLIPKILGGKLSTSIFYEYAKAQKMKSEHETMSTLDKWRIKWEKYCGGYYGFQRQSIIGAQILDKYEKKLTRFCKSNKTASYWNPSQFSTYVLANEIIIRMIMEDMNLDFDKAEKLCLETVDYGIVVADSIEVDYDNGPSQGQTKNKKSISPIKQKLLPILLSADDSSSDEESIFRVKKQKEK